MGLATQGADEAFSHTKRPDLTTVNISIVFIYGLQPMVIVGDTPEKNSFANQHPVGGVGPFGLFKEF